jgi:hypothetical protein
MTAVGTGSAGPRVCLPLSLRPKLACGQLQLRVRRRRIGASALHRGDASLLVLGKSVQTQAATSTSPGVGGTQKWRSVRRRLVHSLVPAQVEAVAAVHRFRGRTARSTAPGAQASTDGDCAGCGSSDRHALSGLLRRRVLHGDSYCGRHGDTRHCRAQEGQTVPGRAPALPGARRSGRPDASARPRSRSRLHSSGTALSKVFQPTLSAVRSVRSGSWPGRSAVGATAKPVCLQVSGVASGLRRLARVGSRSKSGPGFLGCGPVSGRSRPINVDMVEDAP